MSRDPDDVTRALLAVGAWVAFIGSLPTLILGGIAKDKGSLILQLMTTLGPGVALVTDYDFKRQD
jgi:hypothetical protein